MADTFLGTWLDGGSSSLAADWLGGAQRNAPQPMGRRGTSSPLTEAQSGNCLSLRKRGLDRECGEKTGQGNPKHNFSLLLSLTAFIAGSGSISSSSSYLLSPLALCLTTPFTHPLGLSSSPLSSGGLLLASVEHMTAGVRRTREVRAQASVRRDRALSGLSGRRCPDPQLAACLPGERTKRRETTSSHSICFDRLSLETRVQTDAKSRRELDSTIKTG